MHSVPLLESEVSPDPFEQFARWYGDATEASRLPEAAALATATPGGRPSVRMVLVKEHGPGGFVFHTNYESRKGVELAGNQFAALLFYWDALGRQVRLEGPVERVSAAESDEYFATRPLGAQLGTHASQQSRPIASRESLDEQVTALAAGYLDQEVPRPAWWGGYRLRPTLFEYWQNRDDRLHDRLRYMPGQVPGTVGLDGRRWHIERLQP